MGLWFVNFRRRNIECKKQRFKHSSMNSPSLVTSCLEELRIIKMPCVMIAEKTSGWIIECSNYRQVGVGRNLDKEC